MRLPPRTFLIWIAIIAAFMRPFPSPKNGQQTVDEFTSYPQLTG